MVHRPGPVTNLFLIRSKRKRASRWRGGRWDAGTRWHSRKFIQTPESKITTRPNISNSIIYLVRVLNASPISRPKPQRRRRRKPPSGGEKERFFRAEFEAKRSPFYPPFTLLNPPFPSLFLRREERRGWGSRGILCCAASFEVDMRFWIGFGRFWSGFWSNFGGFAGFRCLICLGLDGDLGTCLHFDVIGFRNKWYCCYLPPWDAYVLVWIAFFFLLALAWSME